MSALTAKKVVRKKPDLIQGVIQLGDTISRTNVMFVELKSHGEMDADGKVIFARGYKGKNVAFPDMPLAMLASLVSKCMENFHYSNAEAREKDVKGFKAWAESMVG